MMVMAMILLFIPMALSLNVETGKVTDITTSSANFHGDVIEIDHVNETNCSFKFKDLSSENYTLIKPLKQVNSTGIYNYDIQAKELLNPDTIYEYKAYCEDNVTFAEGSIDQFKTKDQDFQYNEVQWGKCPDTKQGHVNMWILISLFIIIGLAGSLFKSAGLAVLSGFILIFSSMIMWGCGAIFSFALMILGLTFIIIGLSIKPMTK